MSLFNVSFRFVPLAFIGLSVACTALPDDADLEFRTTCTACTLNSPDVDDAPIPELAFDGQENFAGVSLVGLRENVGGRIFEFDVYNDEMIARDGKTIVESGGGLVGWQLLMERDGQPLLARITGYDAAAEGLTDDGQPLTAYAIAYDGLIGGVPAYAINVCPEFAATASEPVLTLIRSQTYDREEKRVDLIDPNWVTFACKGEAAYKAKALGYSESRIFPGSSGSATRAQQDATLKMITADYCGTGHSFTEQGTELHWENRVGSVTATPGPMDPIEAVWGPDGALCLDEPRLTTKPLVEAECGHTIPSCAGFDYSGSWEWKTWKKL